MPGPGPVGTDGGRRARVGAPDAERLRSATRTWTGLMPSSSAAPPSPPTRRAGAREGAGRACCRARAAEPLLDQHLSTLREAHRRRRGDRLRCGQRAIEVQRPSAEVIDGALEHVLAARARCRARRTPQTGRASRRVEVGVDAPGARASRARLARASATMSSRALAQRRQLRRGRRSGGSRGPRGTCRRDLCVEIAVRRGDDAHVDLAVSARRRRGSTSPSSSTRSSFGLQLERQLADLVEEDRAAVARLEAPVASLRSRR